MKPLTVKERNEIIGLCLDEDHEGKTLASMYNAFLRGNAFKFEENSKLSSTIVEDNRRVAAAILCMANYGFVDDYKESDNVAPHRAFRWGRAILYYNGETMTYSLKIYKNNKAAREKFNV